MDGHVFERLIGLALTVAFLIHGIGRGPFRLDSHVTTPGDPVDPGRGMGTLALRGQQAALLVGSVGPFRTSRDEGVFWFAWFLLSFQALSGQENWDVPNKMGAIVVPFDAIIVWVAVGLQLSIQRPRSRGLALVVVATVSLLGLPLATPTPVPTRPSM